MIYFGWMSTSTSLAAKSLGAAEHMNGITFYAEASMRPLSLFLALSAVTFATPAITAAQYAQRMLSPAALKADTVLVRSALETIHPGIYRYTSKREMDAAFAGLERASRSSMSEFEFARRLSLILAKIRCNHTKAENTAGFEKWRQENASHLPFRFRLIGERMYVVSSDPAQAALPRGTQILRINGRPVAELIKTLGAYAPIDGFTQWSRATNLASDSDLMGSDFDHFYPYVYGVSSVWNIDIRTLAGSTSSLKLAPITFKQFLSLDNDGQKYRASFKVDTKLTALDATTMLLAIPTFVNYRDPAQAKPFYDDIFTRIKAAQPEHLIIDLRGNGGGSGDVTQVLLAYLVDRPTLWNHALRAKVIRFGDFPKYIETWGNRKEIFEPALDKYMQQPDGWFDQKPSASPLELTAQQPSALAFSGRVTILTSSINGSGSTMLIAKLKDEGRVRTVGSRSGGSPDGPTSGQIFLMTLPNSKIRVRIPNLFNQMSTSLFDTGKGLSPDIEIAQTPDDFIARRDVVMEAARADKSPAQNLSLGKLAVSWVGTWQGTLTYRDYSNNNMVTLPTKINIAPANQTLTFSYTYEDGKNPDGTEKIVRSHSTVELEPATKAFRVISAGSAANTYRADGLARFLAEGRGQLKMIGKGIENNVAVEVRQTLALAGDDFSLTRETRRAGEDYRVRHVYQMQRVK